MRTGKLQSRYKYAYVWAQKILAGDDDVSISKAYQIDPSFGVLVEGYVKSAEERIKSSRRLMTMAWVYQSKQWAQQTIQQVASKNKQLDLLFEDYRNLSTKEFLTKYPELNVGDEEDIAKALNDLEQKFIDDMQKKFIEALHKVRHAVELLTGVDDD